ncbi:MAG TPA: hypothetical protein VEX17_04425, partial [Bacillales bacterium]|nr:hypothetical protein [Bacillales bacterium]
MFSPSPSPSPSLSPSPSPSTSNNGKSDSKGIANMSKEKDTVLKADTEDPQSFPDNQIWLKKT